jgi:putative membrane protein
MFEIQSGKLAGQRGNPATRKLATQLVKDHQKTTAELKGLIAMGAVKASLPKELSTGEELMLTKLTNLQGDQFSATYVNDMENVHTQAISEFNSYAQAGDNSVLKEWAARTLPTLKRHRDMAGAMDMPH